MTAQTPESIALAFVKAINDRDLAAMVLLMTEGHRFVDSLGAEIRGRSQMRSSWIAYTVMVPDYHMNIDHVLVSGNTVALFGSAAGTISTDGTLDGKNHWEIPAAWRVTVAGNRVDEWQVYADNEPVRAIIGSGGRKETDK